MTECEHKQLDEKIWGRGTYRAHVCANKDCHVVVSIEEVKKK